MIFSPPASLPFRQPTRQRAHLKKFLWQEPARAPHVLPYVSTCRRSSIERELRTSDSPASPSPSSCDQHGCRSPKSCWTQLGHEGHEEGERKRAQQALDQARATCTILVGHKPGLRLTPQLNSCSMKCPAEAHEIEDILAVAKKRDEELARARAAQYAGDADPASMTTSPATTSKTDSDEVVCFIQHPAVCSSSTSRKA